MRYTVEWLIASLEQGAQADFLFFWGHRGSKSGDLTAACFSQWWPAPFVVEAVRYPTTEHWMMAQKALLFDDQETYRQILAAKSPADAKALGRQVRHFAEAAWNARRAEIVTRGNWEKFRQHPDLRAFLLGTNERVLVEASPVDPIWGIGLAAADERAATPARWNGLNLLGFALMEVRELLRA